MFTANKNGSKVVVALRGDEYGHEHGVSKLLSKVCSETLV
jgi:hypothetical protein